MNQQAIYYIVASASVALGILFSLFKIIRLIDRRDLEFGTLIKDFGQIKDELKEVIQHKNLEHANMMAATTAVEKRVTILEVVVDNKLQK